MAPWSKGFTDKFPLRAAQKLDINNWSRADQFLGLKPLDLRPNLLGERKAETI